MDTSAPPEFPSNLKIPVDLFVSKKHHGLRFADSSGDLVFSVDRQSYESTQRRRKQVLLDASGNPLITLYRDHNGSWQGFRGGDTEEYLIFGVERTLNPLCRTEFDVVLVGENSEDLKSDFKMKGCPFQRSCTIYRGNSIAAQDIHQLWVSKVQNQSARGDDLSFYLESYFGIELECPALEHLIQI